MLGFRCLGVLGLGGLCVQGSGGLCVQGLGGLCVLGFRVQVLRCSSVEGVMCLGV